MYSTKCIIKLCFKKLPELVLISFKAIRLKDNNIFEILVIYFAIPSLDFILFHSCVYRSLALFVNLYSGGQITFYLNLKNFTVEAHGIFSYTYLR